VPPLNWPQVICEGGFVATTPVQPGGTLLLDDTSNGKLDTNTLGGADTWTDLTQWLRSGSVNRPANRQQGPVYAYQPGTASVVLMNKDGRFDPDNSGSPYWAAGATELTAMVPIRVRAVWNGISYPLFAGFTDSWTDDGQNYAGHYAESTVQATDAQKVLAGINLATIGSIGSGEATGARINRILTSAGWYTGNGKRTIATGDSTVQATTYGDAAWNLMQVTADSEIGELYLNGSGSLVFRNRHALLTDTRSNTSQATFSDSAATGLAYRGVTRARDDTTIANDVQVTRVGGTLQEAFDQTSINKYLFLRTYSRTDLILTDDPTALQWAQWVLYVAKNDEDRFDQIVIFPLRDPVNLWPQALGREIGDRITISRQPPGVASPITKDCFIRGITHAFDVSGGTWATTWTLQDASRYGSFLVLDNATLGRLDNNALAF
jgi:hypothetical protein